MNQSEQKHTCPACGSTDTSISVSLRHSAGGSDGQVHMRNVHPVFVLGCDTCSHTIRVMREDQVEIRPRAD
jgi:Zn finger protein HypA/HybF involved in hydrogenase expression